MILNPNLFFFYILSDPPNGLPEVAGGRQSHDNDGVSRSRQHTPAWVFPLGACQPSAANERVQNTSGDCQSQLWQRQGLVWARQGPTGDCQANLIKLRRRGEARQQGQVMTEDKSWRRLKLKLPVVVSLNHGRPCTLYVPDNGAAWSCLELLSLMRSQKSRFLWRGSADFGHDRDLTSDSSVVSWQTEGKGAPVM